MARKIDRLHSIKPDLPTKEDDACASHGAGISKMVTLVIATQHEIEGAGIQALLQADGLRVIARCSHEDDLLRSADTYRPDIVMLAEDVVRQEAAKAVSQLRTHNSSVAIIFLLEERDAIMAADLLDLDVEGILLSRACASSLIDCVQSVSHGRKWLDPDLLRPLATAERSSEIASSLTLREVDIVHLVLRGLRNKEIARKLHLSEGTVKMHLHHIYGKLRVGGRTQLAMRMAGACAGMPESGTPSRGEPTAPDSAAGARLQQKNSA
jgi:two-component system nitrate/nitrite response regulator NarL